MKTKKSKKKVVTIVLIIVAVLLLAQWLFIGWRFSFGPFKGLGNIRRSGMTGNGEAYDFSQLQLMESSPLEGKTVLFLGSSVTNGAAALGQSVPEYFSARMGCTAIKEAVDGTTLADSGSDSYIQRMLKNVDASAKIDLVVCQLSTNDASKGKTLGDITESTAMADFDTSTITGAMEYIIAYARDTWGCPVVFYTNARFDSEGYPAMVARVHELEGKWGIGVLDLWTDEGFNAVSDTDRAVYMYDDIHPCKAGYRDWWGPELERQLCEYLEGIA